MAKAKAEPAPNTIDQFGLAPIGFKVVGCSADVCIVAVLMVPDFIAAFSNSDAADGLMKI